MKTYLILGILGFVLNSNAGELLVVSGESYGYMSDRNELLEQSKKDAYSKLPFLNAKLRSQWITWGGNCTPQAMHPKCYYTAKAAFENPVQSAPWSVRATGFGRANEIEGAPELAYPTSIALAKKNANENAKLFCDSETVTPTEIWKVWRGKYDYILAENSFQCSE